MSTARGFRAEWSTRQDFDIYEVFEDVLRGSVEYKLGWVAVRRCDNSSAEVVSGEHVFVVRTAEELEKTLGRLRVLEP